MADRQIELILKAYTSGFEAGMKRASGATKRASKSMTEQLRDVGLAAQTVVGSMRQVINTLSDLYRAGREGAELESLEARFALVSGGAVQAARNLELMRAATKGGATDAVLMANGLRLMASGLADTEEELRIITQTVPALGKQLNNLSADTSLLSYTRMISNGLMSVSARADDFGISVEMVKSRMEDLSAAGLSQRDALQQAVNEELLKKYEELGLGAMTAADEMAAAEAEAGNLANTLKKDLAPISEGIAKGFNALGPLITQGLNGIKFVAAGLLGVLDGLLRTLGQVATVAIDVFWVVANAAQGNFEEARNVADDLLTHIGEIPEAFVSGLEYQFDTFFPKVEETAAMVEEVTKAVEDLGDANASVAERIEAQQDAIIEAHERAADAQIAATRRAEDVAIQAARKRVDATRQMVQAIIKANATYQKAIIQAAREYGKRREELLEQHEERKEAIRARYKESEASAIASRDALALVRARRARDKELGEEERRYAKEKKSAASHYTEQLDAAREARDQQVKDAKRALDDEEQAQRLAALRRAQDEVLARQREQEDLQRALNLRFQAINAEYNEEYAAALRHQQRMAALRWFAAGAPSSAAMTPVSAAMSPTASPSVGGGNSRITVQQNFRFDSSLNAAERQWFRREAYAQAQTAVREVLN